MPQTISDVVSDLSRIPPFPKVTATLLRLLDDPEATIEELATVISSDPSLMLTVTHMANSPFYMCSRRIDNIRDAVLVLGINTIKGITTTISVQQGLRKMCPASARFDPLAYWKHSFATAIAAARYSIAQGTVIRDKAYFVGLIHDVGKIFQAYYWPDSWDTVTKLTRSGEVNYSEVELQILGFNHYDIAVQVLTKWQFPSDIVELLRQMHIADQEASQVSLLGGEALVRAHRTANTLGYVYPEGDCEQLEKSEHTAIEMERASYEHELEYQLRILLT